MSVFSRWRRPLCTEEVPLFGVKRVPVLSKPVSLLDKVTGLLGKLAVLVCRFDRGSVGSVLW